MKVGSQCSVCVSGMRNTVIGNIEVAMNNDLNRHIRAQSRNNFLINLVLNGLIAWFLLKDLPPQGSFTTTQPQIYFGERTSNYVIVRTNEPEFDYPREDANVTTQFSAQSGIPMSWFNRLLFAAELGDINLILNRDINSESRLLWNREITQRMRDVAPFLLYDSDPYIIIGDDGRLYWMQDAFTTSDRFPYSTPLGSLNYIRNSVKAVVDAYDGTVNLYGWDESDPVLKTWEKVFPGVVKAKSEMPADILPHVRYPEDAFKIQRMMFSRYHVTDPAVFYSGQDFWNVPIDPTNSQENQLQPPYYLQVKLPGEPTPEFQLTSVLTHENSNIRSLEARSDEKRGPENAIVDMTVDELDADRVTLKMALVEPLAPSVTVTSLIEMAGATLSLIVPIACPSVMPAFDGPLRSTKNVSTVSVMPSPITGT